MPQLPSQDWEESGITFKNKTITWTLKGIGGTFMMLFFPGAGNLIVLILDLSYLEHFLSVDTCCFTK